MPTINDKNSFDFYDDEFSSFSWTILPHNSALKKTDRSVFIHHGTGIPKKIRDFFQITDLSPGEKRSITLWYENKKYDATLEMTVLDSPRTRLIWKNDFTALLQKKFPKWYEFFKNGEKFSEDTPSIKFQKGLRINEFDVEFFDETVNSPYSNFTRSIQPGDTLTNKDLMQHFKCSPQCGMRRAHRTKSLVLVSDHTKAFYEDRWIDDVFHYTGMGLTGNQILSFQQNKTLANSKKIDISVFLFEVFEEGNYVFIGEVELVGDPYLEKQPDINDNIREVYVFPLKLKEIQRTPAIKKELIQKKEGEIRKKTKKLNIEQLELRAKYSHKGVGKREVTTTTYERNQYVAELAKRKAKGICQLCNQPAPFRNIDGEPYLETHHIVWLSNGGQDVIENTTALCPNCHKKMHILNLKVDVTLLKNKSSQRG